jgi:hypothetical protein
VSDEKCKRCGITAESYNFEADSTFWGWITNEVTTVVTRRVRFLASYYRRKPKYGSPMLAVDERQALCDDCWGLLVGRFMQGRSVDAMPGKEGW